VPGSRALVCAEGRELKLPDARARGPPQIQGPGAGLQPLPAGVQRSEARSPEARGVPLFSSLVTPRLEKA
jgi:hypothetical protein